MAKVVLVGNPRFSYTGAGFDIDIQPAALRSGLAYVATVKSSVNRIYLVVDHVGDFGEQFVLTQCSNRKKLKPRLSDLKHEILANFLPILNEYQIGPENIYLVTEAQCRIRLSSLITGDGKGISCEHITAEVFRRLSAHGDDIVTFWQENLERVNPFTIRGGLEYAIKEFNVKSAIAIKIVNTQAKQVYEFHSTDKKSLLSCAN